MVKDIFDLSGKIALLTGASRGIGEAAARLLAHHGAHVIVSSRKLDDCTRVVESIQSDGGSAEPFSCHVGELDQIEAIFSHIDQTHGHIDILVNNAAANPHYGHILDTDLGSFQKIVDVNIRGYFYMSVAAGKRMRDQGSGGAIVNVASVNAFKPGDKQGIYSISKAAIVNMTHAFARECGPFNIRVNALVPGLTETKFASALHENEEVLNSWLQEIPLGRIAQPDEMASTILYMVSDASSYTTGSCIIVDGGMLA